MVGFYKHSNGTASIFRIEDGGRMFLRVVSSYLQAHAALPPGSITIGHADGGPVLEIVR
jgi:hypothetical protein